MQSIITFRKVLSAFSNKEMPLDNNIWVTAFWKWPSNNQLGTYLCGKLYDLTYIVLLSWWECKKFLRTNTSGYIYILPSIFHCTTYRTLENIHLNKSFRNIY